MKFVKELIKYNTAKEIVFKKWDEFLKNKFKEEDLLNSLGKVSFEDVYSPADLPMFNKAAMDGYAVRAEDTFGASENNVIILNLVEGDSIDENECVKISTGMKIPEGANAVVMKEYCNEEDDFVEIYSGVHPNENVARIGEDVKRGDLILKKGEVITAYHIAILSSLGIKKVKCYNLSVGIISTGDELIDLDDFNKIEDLEKEGRIINSNSFMLHSLIKETGLTPKIYKGVGDSKKKIKETLEKALEENDVVITTGGTSVGDRDYTIESIKELGEFIFHGVQIRPGKPIGFAKYGPDKKLIFVLSGYPVASAVQYELFVRNYFKPRKSIKLPLKRNLASTLGRTDIVRIKIVEEENKSCVEPLRITGSGVISSMTAADGYVIIDENVEGYEKGELVDVYLF
ncbi:MAG: molybdopterin molybdotransferase [Methanothermococcus sp.]|jgi:molybdopterin molybdotransferase|uniref:molybdopterin molybdotransferase MoeA n=1 Tax=Methanothermococcus TaxID=155862 RepID=UPI00037FD76E|nr:MULTISPECIES: molybdopterin molybdotransferase MoeA [Methanothermococcus]MDK2790989.1 molybdopterin molybdotransferase [Methanothermococcus sp.]MDK2987158.1 molybdopterin molybdotransferase [Methanothermococcus sp.]